MTNERNNVDVLMGTIDYRSPYFDIFLLNDIYMIRSF